MKGKKTAVLVSLLILSLEAAKEYDRQSHLAEPPPTDYAVDLRSKYDILREVRGHTKRPHIHRQVGISSLEVIEETSGYQGTFNEMFRM